MIVVTHYLHRPLFPSLLAALRPGGALVYETFTRAQAARGRPTNPGFLLAPGELRRLVAPLDVRAAREGDFEGRWSGLWWPDWRMATNATPGPADTRGG